ncbi:MULTISPECIES: response regulator transcription factor [Cryobacterium]|uniref:response regulator transcription factor n=1 Tax=Cryobacterium TaxID=69578 RepID=UPI000CD4782B|nr:MULTISPECIES: response regulator transcription factor [Cryobacterium]POH67878.1 two-component system response regulator [Cryobacterium zongtaii]TFC47881.1 response regulator transcription factor [Cryobacterium sp. TMN-39-2]
MTAPRTVVIIDDHGLFREGLHSILARDGALNVVGEGATSADATELVATLRPDVLLLDVEIPGAPAETTVRWVTRMHPGTAIVILTMHADRILEAQLKAAGAARYLQKTVASRDLLSVVRTVQAARPVADPTTESAALILTSRELEVLRMVALAYSNREVGLQLSLAEGTVKRHVSNIFTKLDVTSRMGAVRRAVTLGLLG